MTFSEYFIYGLAAHLVADWFFQNDWMAVNKTSLRHAAAWVHSGLHLFAFVFVFAPPVALALAFAHVMIDTRVPLAAWRRLIWQTNDPALPVFLHVSIWQDQAAHILLIVLAAHASVHWL